MYSVASFTFVIFSASSSGISIPNSSSRAITSSTVSRLSAPRSSTKDASGVTSSSSTPSWSTMIFLTRSATGSITLLRGVAGSPSRWLVPRPSAILHVEAAVHRRHLPGDVAGGVRQQEHHGPGDVSGRADAPHRNARGHGLPGLVAHRRGHVRLDEARRHGVDGDAAAGDLAGDSLREPDHPGLAGRVVGLTRVPRHPDH